MAHLSNQQLQERLAFDYKVAMAMRSPIMAVAAFRSAEDLIERRNIIVSEDDGHLATHYLVEYHINTLIGPDSYSTHTKFHFDLLANGNYPFSEPSCWVIGSDMPWSPVFHRGRPIATLNSEWYESQGGLLLGHLLVRVAMLLNFDRLPQSSNYVGYNEAAIKYWQTHLDMRPINPQLAYPVLPDGVNNWLVEHLVRKVKGRTDKVKQPLSVFLCHAREDKLQARTIYDRLCAEGLDPWLDAEKLLPGQDWRQESIKAVRNAHAVIVCLSRNSINKKGFVQYEIKQALDVADEQPEGTIFLIPLKLEECDIPERLSRWHCVGLFEDRGYERLMDSLLLRANTLEVNTWMPDRA